MDKDKEYDSKEEEYFHWWLLELQLEGYIEWIDRNPSSYVLNEAVNKMYEVIVSASFRKNAKVVSPIKSYVLIKQKTYTPDFIFKWTDKAKGVFVFKEGDVLTDVPFFFCNNDDMTCYVDVKGSYTKRLASSITFPDRQVLMLVKHGVYVQKVIPYSSDNNNLFAATFTPSDVITTEVYRVKGKNHKVGQSKFKFKVNTLHEYTGTEAGITD